jgi:phosphohistidine swiveling domain-containing protein
MFFLIKFILISFHSVEIFFLIIFLFILYKSRNIKKEFRILLITLSFIGLFIFDQYESVAKIDMPVIKLFPVNNVSMMKETIPDPYSPVEELKSRCVVIYFGELGSFLECHPAEGYLIRPSNFKKSIPTLNKLRAKGMTVLFLAPEETIDNNKNGAIDFLKQAGIPIIAYTYDFIDKVSKHPMKNLRFRLAGGFFWKQFSIRFPDHLSWGLKKPIVIRRKDMATIKNSQEIDSPFIVTVSSFLKMDDDEIEKFVGTHQEKGIFLLVGRSQFSDIISSVDLLERFQGNLKAVVTNPQRYDEEPGIFLTVNRLIIIIFFTLFFSFCIEISSRYILGRIRMQYNAGLISQTDTTAWNFLCTIFPLLPVFIAAKYLDNFAVPVALSYLVTPLVYTSNLYLWPVFFVFLFSGFFLRGKRFFPPYRQIYYLFFSLLAIPVTLKFITGEFPFFYILVAAPSVLLPVLCIDLFQSVRQYSRRKKVGNSAGWATLQEVAGLKKAGLKAARLGMLSKKIKEVPPGIVVWISANDTHDPNVLRQIRKTFKRIPVIFRSTAPGEDSEKNTAAGKYVSTIVYPVLYDSFSDYEKALADALFLVVSSYPPGYEFSPVLCMPLIKADRSGVAVTHISSTGFAMIEESSGTNYVTSGAGVPERLYVSPVTKQIYRCSGEKNSEQSMNNETALRLIETIEVLSPHAPVYVEWVSRGKKWWIVQLRPIADSSLVDKERENWIAHLKETLGIKKYKMFAFFAPDLPVLERLFTESIPCPAAPETVQFWAKQWQRDGSFGVALSLLGVPLYLIPSRVVLSVKGELFAYIPAFRILAIMISFLIKTQSVIFRKTSEQIAEKITLRIINGLKIKKDFTTLAASSIALRLLYNYLLENGKTPSTPSISLKLSNAIFHFNETNNYELLLPEFACNSAYDLDPACPRYMEKLPDGSIAPDLKYILLPKPLPEPPETISQSWCALYRDYIHSHLCYDITRIRLSNDEWLHREKYTGWTPPHKILTVNTIEKMAFLQLTDYSHSEGMGRGQWVSGAGPVEGIATYKLSGEMRPDSILVITHPLPEFSAYFSKYRAVVAETGGMLSHSAIVARENRTSALFSVSGINKKVHEGDTIQLTEDGDVMILTDPTPKN